MKRGSKMKLFHLVAIGMAVIIIVYMLQREPGSSVGIVTGYGLDGPGIESR
jgi:hypothetical protein